MSAPRKPQSKIGSPEQVARWVAREKRAGRRVVFTNGVFDLLHKGHVSYLNEARRLGDRLVVALNSDASVRRIKGPTRPLNRLRDRLEVMAALECVDYVTSFSGDIPLSVIKKVRPDVLVKGGDWKVENMVGAKEVLSWGGEVHSLDFVKGRSTTKLIQKAKAR